MDIFEGIKLMINKKTFEMTSTGITAIKMVESIFAGAISIYDLQCCWIDGPVKKPILPNSM